MASRIEHAPPRRDALEFLQLCKFTGCNLDFLFNIKNLIELHTDYMVSSLLCKIYVTFLFNAK